MLTPFGRFLLWCATLFLGWTWLATLVDAPWSAIVCAPFLVLLWGLVGKGIIILFGSDELPFAAPEREPATRPVASRPRPMPGGGGGQAPSASPPLGERRHRDRPEEGLSDLGAASAGAFGAWLALRDAPEVDAFDPGQPADGEPDDFDPDWGPEDCDVADFDPDIRDPDDFEDAF